jgi:aldehyde dehydrogenase (NAD+)
MVREMRKVFLSGRTRDLKFRTTQLRRLLQLVEENLNAFYEALSKDLRKPQHESMISDVGYLLRDIRHALQNFKNWAKPTTAPKHLYTPFDKYTIQHDPYGLVCTVFINCKMILRIHYL